MSKKREHGKTTSSRSEEATDAELKRWWEKRAPPDPEKAGSSRRLKEGNAEERFVFCSFCGTAEYDLVKVVSGGDGLLICEECVDLCKEIFITRSQTTITRQLKQHLNFIQQALQITKWSADRVLLALVVLLQFVVLILLAFE